jgi:DNA-binding transcriptional LysR family regulator
MFPAERLAGALKRFNGRFPTVPIRLRREALGDVERLVRSGGWSLGIGGAFHLEPRGLQQFALGAVRIIPVAAAGHPLAEECRRRPGATREHLQIVLSEHLGARAPDHGVIGAAVWRVGDLASKHALLRAGLGWGGMPEPMVRADLEAGRLVHLDLPDWRGGEYPLPAIYKDDRAHG